jgi:hypothetical protein
MKKKKNEENQKFGMSKAVDDTLEQFHNKGYKIFSHPDVMKDMEQVPDDVLEELDRIIVGLKNGTIDPSEIGEPVDMRELQKEDPQLCDLLVKRAGEAARGQLV